MLIPSCGLDFGRSSSATEYFSIHPYPSHCNTPSAFLSIRGSGVIYLASFKNAVGCGDSYLGTPLVLTIKTCEYLRQLRNKYYLFYKGFLDL